MDVSFFFVSSVHALMLSSRRCNVIESLLGLTLSFEGTVPLNFLYKAFYTNPERRIQSSFASILMLQSCMFCCCNHSSNQDVTCP